MTATTRGTVGPVALRVGCDALSPVERAGAHTLVARVDDAGLAALTGCDTAVAARALAVVRRADLLVPASTAVADALAAMGPVRPWDMLVAEDPSPDRIDAALARLRARPARPRRLAFVTPLPPDPTGVALYSHRLAEALARRALVTCFVSGALDADRRPHGAALEPVDALDARLGSGEFDELVYVLGNQPRHGTQLALLRQHPGAVQLHDVRLVGAYAGLHAPGSALADELQRVYPGRYAPSVLRERSLTMGPSVEADVWFVREVAALATTVLTHSAHAAALVTADAGVTSASIGPLAYPVATPRIEPSDADEPFVVTVGAVDASKRAEVLVDAVGALPGRPVLVFVGPVAAAERAALQRRADALGVGDRVVLTGRVDDDELARWLRRAAVAVQLRAHSNGESSAAVADCLAHGVPTIVSDLGALAELPGAAVATVAAGADADTLAEVLGALLGDTGRRRALHHAALAEARSNGFDAAAERLLTALFGPDR